MKQSKASVHYRRGERDRRCENCTMFRAPNGCTAVEGKIDPDGQCDLFEKRKDVPLVGQWMK